MQNPSAPDFVIHFQCLPTIQICLPTLNSSSFIPGAPHPNFSKGMHDEHCAMWGFDVELTTSNYGLTTTPRNEYEISTGKRECPEKDMQDKKGRRVRVIRRIEELRRLTLCSKACLTDDEILAVVHAKYGPNQFRS
jgi:hypothetical protein